MTNPPHLYLIDASIYIFQAHFSPAVECYDRKGNELSALFGFTLFLAQFVRRTKPAHIAIAHDASLFCGFRHDLCPDYKSNRELPDENLEMQLNGCAEVCEILGLPSFVSKVYEADDIIGTLAGTARAAHPAVQLSIVTRDKDLAQLLETEQDCLWDYNGNRRRYRRDIIDEFGIDPGQFPDYLGLIGDSVDCIRGVPGVGPVKARALLREFRDLDGVYANLDKVSALKLRGAKGLADALAQHKPLAELGKRLATIVRQVADESFGSASLTALQPGPPDRDGFAAFLEQYGFRDGDRERLLGMVGAIGGG